MNIFDKAREYIVIVENGSGCLFQASNPDFSYILTAKHNTNNKLGETIDITRFKFEDNNWQEISIDIGTLTEGKNYFPHSDKDIAIILIPPIDYLTNIYKLQEIRIAEEGFSLFGYPETRRNANPNNKHSWFRTDPNITLLNSNQGGLQEAIIPGCAEYNEVVGHSGGGILQIKNDKLYIAGIQNKMAEAIEENLGRIEFTPINYFDEIIKSFTDQLAELHPPYLDCFSFLQDEAFSLDAGFQQQNIEFTKNFLVHKCHEVINSDITPKGIKNYFKEKLLIDTNKTEDLDSSNIWKLWLEFITIINIVKDENLQFDDLSTLFNSVRLLFSDSDGDWSEEISNLVYSDYTGLKDNGVVIVGIDTPPLANTFVIDPNRMISITNARKQQDRSKLRIDDGIRFPFDAFKFVHIAYFKEASIILKHQEYAEIQDEQVLLDKLKQEYGELIEA